jgi:hypothetical protein
MGKLYIALATGIGCIAKNVDPDGDRSDMFTPHLNPEEFDSWLREEHAKPGNDASPNTF